MENITSKLLDLEKTLDSTHDTGDPELLIQMLDKIKAKLESSSSNQNAKPESNDKMPNRKSSRATKRKIDSDMVYTQKRTVKRKVKITKAKDSSKKDIAEDQTETPNNDGKSSASKFLLVLHPKKSSSIDLCDADNEEGTSNHLEHSLDIPCGQQKMDLIHNDVETEPESHEHNDVNESTPEEMPGENGLDIEWERGSFYCILGCNPPVVCDSLNALRMHISSGHISTSRDSEVTIQCSLCKGPFNSGPHKIHSDVLKHSTVYHPEFFRNGDKTAVKMGNFRLHCLACVPGEISEFREVVAWRNHIHENHVEEKEHASIIKCKGHDCKWECSDDNRNIMTLAKKYLNHCVKLHLESFVSYSSGTVDVPSISTEHRMQFLRKSQAQKETVTCEHCQGTFELASISKHRRTCNKNENAQSGQATQTRKVCCDICGMLVHKKALKKHQAQMHSIGMDIKCDLCNHIKFTNEKNLKWHQWTVHDIVPVDASLKTCKTCDKQVPSMMMGRHNAQHRVFCTKCQGTFANPAELKRHRNEVHQTSETKDVLVKCQYCNFTKTAIAMKAHMALRHGIGSTHQCEECPFKAASAAVLERHMLSIHPGGKKSNYCDICPRQMASKEAYMHHMYRWHDQRVSDRPILKCNECDMTTVTRIMMNKHISERHIKGDYPCPACDKTFRLSRSRDQHFRRHHKKMQCVLCKSLFKTRQTMLEHVVLEHDRGIFMCSKCMFTTLSAEEYVEHNWNAHKRRVEPEYPTVDFYTNSEVVDGDGNAGGITVQFVDVSESDSTISNPQVTLSSEEMATPVEMGLMNNDATSEQTIVDVKKTYSEKSHNPGLEHIELESNVEVMENSSSPKLIQIINPSSNEPDRFAILDAVRTLHMIKSGGENNPDGFESLGIVTEDGIQQYVLEENFNQDSYANQMVEAKVIIQGQSEEVNVVLEESFQDVSHEPREEENLPGLIRVVAKEEQSGTNEIHNEQLLQINPIASETVVGNNELINDSCAVISEDVIHITQDGNQIVSTSDEIVLGEGHDSMQS